MVVVYNILCLVAYCILFHPDVSMQVLARGERIENLVDKTDTLRFQADRFHRTGVALRRKMWWNNKKMWLIIIALVLVLALVIFLSVCFSGGNCFKH
jgi:vesicle-associated membrane protein 72